MGVGSSREIEEQLEAALSLLDAARAKQEQLKGECDNLQHRIQSQANTLLAEETLKRSGSIHLVQEAAPLSKRVLFVLAIATPLAMHISVSAVSISIADWERLLQGVLLWGAVLLLLRFRRYRWRRIKPGRVVHANEPAASPRPPFEVTMVDGGASTVAPQPTSALLASEEELAVLAEVRAGLRREPPSEEAGLELLPEDEQLLDVQLVRFLKEHGLNAGKIEGCATGARPLEWRLHSLRSPSLALR